MTVRVLIVDDQEPFRLAARMVVDATDVEDRTAVADAIVPGKLPAFGLRDFTVARNFHLAEVV